MAKATKAKRSARGRSQPTAFHEPAPQLQPTTYISPLAQRALPAVSWYEVISTGFFSGYLPKAPGTWGSVVAALIFLVTARLLPGSGCIQIGPVPVSWWALLTGTLATIFGIIASGKLAAEWREKDPGEVVIDEFAGVFFAASLIVPDFTGILAAFVFFRLFDILKPGPIHSLQDMPGGYGIVLDDVLAGLVSAPLALGVQMLAKKFFGG